MTLVYILALIFIIIVLHYWADCLLDYMRGMKASIFFSFCWVLGFFIVSAAICSGIALIIQVIKLLK